MSNFPIAQAMEIKIPIINAAGRRVYTWSLGPETERLRLLGIVYRATETISTLNRAAFLYSIPPNINHTIHHGSREQHSTTLDAAP